ncbi:MAG: hypothetical protein ACU0DH_00470 [Paracoccus sp. (in: a-proteobacteria)]
MSVRLVSTVMISAQGRVVKGCGAKGIGTIPSRATANRPLIQSAKNSNPSPALSKKKPAEP